jgi:hypothetical protein
MNDSLLARFDQIVDSLASAEGMILKIRSFTDPHLDWICRALGRFVDKPSGMVRIQKRVRGTNESTGKEYTIVPRGRTWSKPIAIVMENIWPQLAVQELLHDRPYSFYSFSPLEWSYSRLHGIEPDTLSLGYGLQAIIPTAIPLRRDGSWLMPLREPSGHVTGRNVYNAPMDWNLGAFSKMVKDYRRAHRSWWLRWF